MEFKLRELVTGDIFKLSRILRKLNLKLDFNNKTQEQLGGELVLSIISNLDLAEDDIAEFVGDLAGLTSEEFKNLPITETTKLFKAFKEIKGIDNFFKLAGQLTK